MRFDLIGSRETGAVAILHVAEGEDPLKLSEEAMRRHKHVKSVLMRAGPRAGPHRLRPLVLIAGSEDTEVIHREHGYRLKLDPRRVYFSPREGTDRALVARTVGPGEIVLVMFAGVGPYGIAIAKAQPMVHEVVGVEVSEDAYRYFVENARLNGVEGKVRPILGDVREVCPPMFGRFDRVLMPLPMEAYEFLSIGLRCMRPKGGTLHFYYWGAEDAVHEATRMVREEANQLCLNVDPTNWRRVASYSPHKWKFRVDFLVSPQE